MSAETRETFRFLQQENARLQDENRRLREEVDSLRHIVNALPTLQALPAQITGQTDVLALLDKILYSALAVIDAADGSLLLYDDDAGDLVFAVTHGAQRGRLDGHRIPSGKGIAHWVLERREPVRIADVRQDPRFWPGVDEAFEFVTHSMLCAPIATPDRAFGVLTALNKRLEREFTEADLALLSIVAQLAAPSLERAEKSPP